MQSSEYVELPGGIRMPMLGLGTWQSSGEDVKLAVRAALDCGYRLIDTAFSYQNEAEIGEVLHEQFTSGKIKREDIFLTTKLPCIFMGNRENVRRGFEKSLSRLNLDYVDLYLIHSPMGIKYTDDTSTVLRGKDDVVHHDLVETWKAMEELVDEGRVKAIGVSNFSTTQVDRVRAHARYPVANQQVECHAYFPQSNMVNFCNDRGITITSYASLGSGCRIEGLLVEPVVVQIAQAHDKTPAQILLRNLIQRGICVIPKSIKPDRIRQNIQVFDFKLTSDEMKYMEGLDKKKRFFSFWSGMGHPEEPWSQD